jgi:hypothetical protein
MKALASCLLLLLCLGFSQLDPATSIKLLNCRIESHIPDEPAMAEQGGYLFAYQSLRGVTDDERACTVYRLMNTPDKPPTPLRWTIGDETVVDKVRLPRCSNRETCHWLTFAKYFAGEADTNLSTLSYGLNADAYQEQVDTFIAHFGVADSQIAEAEAVLASSVGSEIAGVFATGDDALITLHLIARSRFEPEADGVRLIYELEDLSSSGILDASTIRVEWTALSTITPVAALLNEAEDESVASAGQVVRTDNAIQVIIPAQGFALDQSFVLEVYAEGDAEPLVATEMPAYVPTSIR